MRENSKMKTSSSFEIPASVVKLYFYCPQIPYIVFNFGLKERVTELMVSGREKHVGKLRRLKKRGWKVNVFLRSERYGVCGYVDAFKKEESGYVVLELKNTEYRREVVKTHLYQAACYALMVEENFGRVCRIEIEYEDRKVSFPFTKGIKKYCVSIINKIRKIADGELVSYRIEERKCKNCGFLKFCKGI